MKKHIAMLCMIISLLLCACSASKVEVIPAPSISGEDLVGKTLDELGDVLVIDRELRAYGYGFATDTWGNPVVYEWDLTEDDQFLITHAEVFAVTDTDASPEVFETIKPGMTIYEVVKLVGNPVNIPATGFFYIIFQDNTGQGHAIAWGGEPLAVEFISGNE